MGEKTFKLCFVAVAARKSPKLQNGHFSSKDASNMRQKIETIFKIAIDKGHSTIILSALGCGAYKNPPKDVAKIFDEVISMYHHYFKTIKFAILDNNHKRNMKQRTGNFYTFHNVLNNKHDIKYFHPPKCFKKACKGYSKPGELINIHS